MFFYYNTVPGQARDGRYGVNLVIPSRTVIVHKLCITFAFVLKMCLFACG